MRSTGLGPEWPERGQERGKRKENHRFLRSYKIWLLCLQEEKLQGYEDGDEARQGEMVVVVQKRACLDEDGPSGKMMPETTDGI